MDVILSRHEKWLWLTGFMTYVLADWFTTSYSFYKWTNTKGAFWLESNEFIKELYMSSIFSTDKLMYTGDIQFWVVQPSIVLLAIKLILFISVVGLYLKLIRPSLDEYSLLLPALVAAMGIYALVHNMHLFL